MTDNEPRQYFAWLVIYVNLVDSKCTHSTASVEQEFKTIPFNVTFLSAVVLVKATAMHEI